MLSFLKPSGPQVKRIDPAEAVKRAAKGELTVIDVRDAGELRASGKAESALHIPLSLIRTKADPRHPEFDKRLSAEKPVALYCASGARSQSAAQALLGMGYTEVYNLGNLPAWRSGGGKVVPA